MNTFNARNNLQRTICATLATVVTVFAIAIATLAGRPYLLPGQAQFYVAAAGAAQYEARQQYAKWPAKENAPATSQ